MYIPSLPKVKSKSLTNRQVASLTAVVVLIIYLSSLAPTLFTHDSAELAAGASSLGIVHSPGYAVYLLVAHAFTFLPFGDVAYRVNLLSAISTVTSVFILVLLLRELSVPRVIASITGCLFALSFYTWSLSVITEVYTFQVCLLILLLWGAWLWQKTANERYLYSVTFLLGLSAANNPATILWWGGIFLLLKLARPKQPLTWQIAGKALLLFLLGTAFILYLPIRSLANPALNYAGDYDQMGLFHPLNLTDLNNLIWYLSGGPFHSWMGNYTFLELIDETKATILRLNATFLGIGLPLGLWGIVALWRKYPSVTVAFLLTFTPHLLFFTVYRAPDKDTMFLPLYLIWAVFIGIGLSQFVQFMPKRTASVLWLLPVAFFVINRPYVDVESHYTTRIEARERLESAEPNSLYFGIWSDAAAMKYLQITEDMRLDVSVINIFLAQPNAQRQIITTAFQADRTVYTSFKDPSLARSFRFVPIKHGFQITPQDF